MNESIFFLILIMFITSKVWAIISNRIKLKRINFLRNLYRDIYRSNFIKNIIWDIYGISNTIQYKMLYNIRYYTT